jgi:hypothetical protein
VLAPGVGESVEHPLAEIDAALALDVGDRAMMNCRQRLARLERDRDTHRETAAFERRQEIAEKGLMQARRRGRTKMTYQTRLDSTRYGRLGEDQKASGLGVGGVRRAPSHAAAF